MMRYAKTSSTSLSEDDSSTPRRLRFGEAGQEIIDMSLKEGGGNTIELPASMSADFEIPLGAVAVGRWLYIYSSGDGVELKISTSANPDLGPFLLAKDRPTEMWVTYTAVKVKNTGNDIARLTYGIGGE